MSTDKKHTPPLFMGPGCLPMLSVRAPWWWWILYGSKDLENRSWSTRYRGPVLIHASQWPGTLEQIAEMMEMHGQALAMQAINEEVFGAPRVNPGDPAERGARWLYSRGYVVGVANLVDVVVESDSPWFQPDTDKRTYGLILGDRTPLRTPYATKGALGLRSHRLPEGFAYPPGFKPMPRSYLR